MAKIKITSNPYDKLIKYSHWHANTQQWENVDYSHYSDSQLISDELTTCFFPFKANKILDVIIEEFNDGHIDLVFAGTEDEYNMLPPYKDNVSTISVRIIPNFCHRWF